MSEEIYNLEITESEIWTIAIALHELSRNSISELQKDHAQKIFNRLKNVVLERDGQRLIEANARKASGH